MKVFVDVHYSRWKKYKIDFEKNPTEKELDELKKWKNYKDDKK